MNYLRNTYSPFGLEKNGNCYFLKCILSKDDLHHINIKSSILETESNIDNLNCSNLREFNENQDIIKFRVKNWKSNLYYKIEYQESDSYLKTLEDIGKNDKIDIEFYYGKEYESFFNNKKYKSIPVFVKKIIIK